MKICKYFDYTHLLRMKYSETGNELKSCSSRGRKFKVKHVEVCLQWTNAKIILWKSNIYGITYWFCSSTQCHVECLSHKSSKIVLLLWKNCINWCFTFAYFHSNLSSYTIVFAAVLFQINAAWRWFASCRKQHDFDWSIMFLACSNKIKIVIRCI